MPFDQQRIFGQSKLLNHPQKIARWMGGGDDTLITVEIDLTNRCNNACPGCAGGRRDRQAELTSGEAWRILCEVRSAGALAVIFTGGGEPLLHPAAVSLMTDARGIGFDVGLITNGLTLDRPAEVLASCAWVRVSLDASDPAMYRATHGVDRFDAVLANIAALVEAKARTGSACTIGLGYLTGKHTIRGMEGFLEIATELGVDYAQFRPYHGDTSCAVEHCAELKAQYPVATASWHKYGHFDDEDKRPYGECYGRHFVTVVGADANVYVCCHMRGLSRYALGNLRSESFATIWARRHTIPIDFADCPYFCRCDEFNRLTWEIAKPKQHVTFL